MSVSESESESVSVSMSMSVSEFVRKGGNKKLVKAKVRKKRNDDEGDTLPTTVQYRTVKYRTVKCSTEQYRTVQ